MLHTRRNTISPDIVAGWTMLSAALGVWVYDLGEFLRFITG